MTVIFVQIVVSLVLVGVLARRRQRNRAGRCASEPVLLQESVLVVLTDHRFCVRTVSHCPPKPWGDTVIYMDAEAHRCCGKWLIGSVLERFGVRQHA